MTLRIISSPYARGATVKPDMKGLLSDAMQDFVTKLLPLLTKGNGHPEYLPWPKNYVLQTPSGNHRVGRHLRLLEERHQQVLWHERLLKLCRRQLLNEPDIALGNDTTPIRIGQGRMNLDALRGAA